jgi:hypothetical protein
MLQPELCRQDAESQASMYILRRFHIVEIAGDGEFAWIADQSASLPTNPVFDLAATSQHVGLIE